jgi:AAA domain
VSAGPSRSDGDRASWQRVVVDGLEARGHVTRHRGGDHVEFRCPAHDDSKPSGTADYDAANGATLIRCHQGCATADVLAAIGCTLADLFDQPPAGPSRPPLAAAAPICQHRLHIEDRHPYRRADGTVVNTVIRKRCSLCKTKDVRPARPWPVSDRILYRLPGVLAAIADGATIWVHEGEGCADAWAEAGHVSTTNPFGAGKWLDSYTESLRGARQIVIVADNDLPGYRHAADVAARLTAAGIPVTVVRAATSTHKADIVDHIAAGGTAETLTAVDPAAIAAQLAGDTAADSSDDDGRLSLALPATVHVPAGQRIPVDPLALPASLSLLDSRRYDGGEWPYIVPGLLPVGLVLICGRPGGGKTTISAQLEHCVATGLPIAGYQPETPGRCLIIDYEGGPLLAINQSLRIAPWGELPTDYTGDPDEMIAVRTRWPGATFGERCTELEKAMRDAAHEGRPYRYVRIDTMRAFMGAPPQGMNSYQWDADCLIRVNALAREMAATIVVIHHPNKSGEISGSVGVEGSCSAAYMLQRKAGETEGILKCIKNRVGPEISYAVEYNLRAGIWEFSDSITTAQAANTGIKRAIIDYLTGHGPSAGPDIRAGLPGTRDRTVRDMLTRLRADGWITRSDDGLWRLAAMPTPDTPSQPTGPPAAAAPHPADQPQPRKQYPLGCCTVCRTPMTVVMPGQTTHPLCDPDPAPGPAAAPPAAAGQPAGHDGQATADGTGQARDGSAPETCPVCGELVTVADTHPECGERQDRAARWPGVKVMTDGIGKSRMKPLPWIPPADHAAARPGMDNRDMPQWQAAAQVDIGAFRWRLPSLGELDPDALVSTLDRTASYPASCSSVPVAPNVLRPVQLDGDPKEAGLAGVAEVNPAEWMLENLPHPLGRQAVPGQPLIIPSGSLEELWALHRQGLIGEPQVTRAWMGRRNTSLFEPFYKAVRAARAEHAGDPAMTGAVKTASSIAIRLLYPRQAKSPWWRPDWYGAIVGQAMWRHWIRARQAVDAGAVLVYLGSVDEAAYLIPPGVTDPAAWAPEPYKVDPAGQQFGSVKHKPVPFRLSRADLSGIDPARIRPNPNRDGYVEVSGPLPLRLWQERAW